MNLRELTWGDLNEWAGPHVVERGKACTGAVEDLSQTPDGRLVAWVQGGQRYATVVATAASGELVSTCTCPYSSTCKHAVAVVLVFLERLGTGEEVPQAENDDPRLTWRPANAVDLHDVGEVRIDWMAEDDTDLYPLYDDAELDDFDPEWPSYESAWRGSGAGRWGFPRAEGESASDTPPDPGPAVRRYLATLSGSDLLDLLTELAADIPAVRARLLERAPMDSGRVWAVVEEARREIQSVSSQPGWTRPWSGEGYTPDYSGVRRRLRWLISAHQADAVVALAEDLMELGFEQVAQSDDEGETAQEVAGCLAIVLRALGNCSMSAPERLLWEIDARLRDDYGVLDDCDGVINEGASFTQADWSEVADLLEDRLASVPPVDHAEPHLSFARLRRGALLHAAVGAFERAGRDDEAIALLEREVEATLCWTDLVDRLLARDRLAEALEWGRRGYSRTVGEYIGIARSMLDHMVEAARRANDLPLAAALLAEMFFHRPDEGSYEAVREETDAIGLWEATRPHLLTWLETGVRPDGRKSAASAPDRRSRASATGAGARGPQRTWPLPDPGLNVPCENPGYLQFPELPLLIDIAIHEGRVLDALSIFDRALDRDRHALHVRGAIVAEAVCHEHPDRALAIWKELALREIAKVKRDAYERAGMLLWKMHRIYVDTGRSGEWDALLAELRQANSRRPRMIEVLDRLTVMPERIADL